MPYQNLDSEFMFAVAIWLLAILVFFMMLLVVCAKLFSEKWFQKKDGSLDELQTVEEALGPSQENISKKDTELQNTAFASNSEV